MQFLEGTLQVTQPDEVLAASVPAGNMRDFTVERECVRRCFWVVQTMFLINGIYTYRPLRPRTVELVRKIRLPVDENSFELARITSQPGEPPISPPLPPWASPSATDKSVGWLAAMQRHDFLFTYRVFAHARATEQICVAVRPCLPCAVAVPIAAGGHR